MQNAKYIKNFLYIASVTKTLALNLNAMVKTKAKIESKHDGKVFTSIIKDVWGTAECFKSETGISNHLVNKMKKTKLWSVADRGLILRKLKEANVNEEVRDRIYIETGTKDHLSNKLRNKDIGKDEFMIEVLKSYEALRKEIILIKNQIMHTNDR